jgi:hypothetical protein
LCESASKNQPHEVSLAFGTPLGVGTSHGHLDTQDSPRPGFGGSHHLPPYSIFCSSPWRLHPNGTNSWDSRNGVPKWSPEIVLAGLLELWTDITPDCRVRSQQGLNQSCSPRRDLFNAMLHAQTECREEVDSRLLVVGSQIGPSFVHNLGCRCPNDQCEAIFDIYISRPLLYMISLHLRIWELWVFLDARSSGCFFCRVWNISWWEILVFLSQLAIGNSLQVPLAS